MHGADRARAARPRPGRPARTVVLVGGGHAHVQVLRRFAMDPPEAARLVVVLDRSVAVYSGMVPGLVAGDYSRSALEIDVVPLARRAGAAVVLAAAVDLDPERRELLLEDRPPIRFDLASLDVGSTIRDLAFPGVAEHALATRPIGAFAEALEARTAALASLASPARPARVLVVGAGAAGCELAFTLEARLRRAGTPARIAIATGEDALLARGTPALRRAIAREAAARGLEVRTATRIVRVERDAAFSATGERLEADLVVWATGAAAQPFPRREVATRADSDGAGDGHGRRAGARLARDREGFLEIRDTLQTVGFENVFAVGDCARLVEHPWVPRAGVYAVRQGPILDRNLRALLAGRPLSTYRPQRDFLSLLNLGDGRALGAKWGLARAGRGVFRLKDRIDRAFMARFQVLEDPAAWGAAIDAAGRDGMVCGGCAAKLAARPLEAALARLPAPPPDASVVAGVAEREDVAVTRAADGGLVLHNIDAIRAFCDDPWLVGRVAAVNATGDLYAKGGTPRHAQALIALPEDAGALGEELLHQALLGLRATLDPLGVALVGGHTMTSDAFAIGLAMTGGGPREGELLRQAGSRADDELWLTKPLGTGVVLAADARGLARGAWIEAAHASMLRPLAAASRIALSLRVHAATDVTGFGLAGHLLNLLRPAGLAAELEPAAIPLLPGARELLEAGLRSSAHAANRDAFETCVRGASAFDAGWLFDPQTAGGLLFAAAPGAGPQLVRAFEAAGEPPIVRIGRIGPIGTLEPIGRIRPIGPVRPVGPIRPDDRSGSPPAAPDDPATILVAATLPRP